MRGWACLVVLLVLSAGCADDADTVTVEGSGTVATETRDVERFDRISLAGMGTVLVEVGPEVSLKVEAEDNVLPHLTTDAAGGTLRIGSTEGTSFGQIVEPVYTLATPDLAGVSIAGSGRVVVSGIETGGFEASIGGSGRIDAAGSASSLRVTVSGSGGFEGESLTVAEAAVEVAGSGTVRVHATDTLEVSIAGSGSVTYSGDPLVTESITGSGSISRG